MEVVCWGPLLFRDGFGIRGFPRAFGHKELFGAFSRPVDTTI